MSMLNHSGKKARLTFKLETDELWINTGKKNIREFLKFIRLYLKRKQQRKFQ